MSEENVEVVRRLYGLWPDRVLAAEEVLHPDVVIDVTRNVLTPPSSRLRWLPTLLGAGGGGVGEP